MLSYLKYNGETDGLIFSGGTDKATFKNFMEEILLPTAKAGDIVIMDNLKVHKNSFDKMLFEKKGVEIKYLPRYSPEYNPIEMMWSKVKTYTRKKNPGIFSPYGAKQVLPNWILPRKTRMDGINILDIVIKILL